MRKMVTELWGGSGTYHPLIGGARLADQPGKSVPLDSALDWMIDDAPLTLLDAAVVVVVVVVVVGAVPLP